MSERWNSASIFVLGLAAGAAVRLVLISTSIGTNDVLFWMAFARLADHVGIGPAYSLMPEYTHPPLSMALLLALERLRPLVGIETTDLLRTVQLLFDLIAAGALVSIARSLELKSRFGVAMYYFLSPVAVMTSGFHGNTDPTLISLVLVSIALLVLPRPLPAAAGLCLAAATGIKVVAILLAPLIFLAIRRRWRFGFSYLAGLSAVFLPFVATGGIQVITQTFGYASQTGNFGAPYFLMTLANFTEAPLRDFFASSAGAYIRVARFTVLGVIAAYTIALIAIRRPLDGCQIVAGCGAIYLTLLATGPGGGVQYYLWLVPFLPFALPRVAHVTISGTLAVAQFTYYTVWSDGFPWWYADGTVSRPGYLVAYFTNLVWLVIVVGAFLAIRTTLSPKPSSALRRPDSCSPP
jgi:hypothetical protein